MTHQIYTQYTTLKYTRQEVGSGRGVVNCGLLLLLRAAGAKILHFRDMTTSANLKDSPHR